VARQQGVQLVSIWGMHPCWRWVLAPCSRMYPCVPIYYSRKASLSGQAYGVCVESIVGWGSSRNLTVFALCAFLLPVALPVAAGGRPICGPGVHSAGRHSHCSHHCRCCSCIQFRWRGLGHPGTNGAGHAAASQGAPGEAGWSVHAPSPATTTHCSCPRWHIESLHMLRSPFKKKSTAQRK
jgi:hypothetical protein